MGKDDHRNKFFDPAKDTTKRTGVTPDVSPYEEPEFADVGTEEHDPGEVIQYPAPRPPLVSPLPKGVPEPPVPPPPVILPATPRSTQADWEQADPNDTSYIRNKPRFETPEQSDWLNSNEFSLQYIRNKPEIPPADAEKNVQVDWNERVTSSDAFIKNKPRIPEGRAAGTGMRLTGNVLSVENPFTTTQANKLAGIEAGAEVNVTPDWNAVSGSTAFIDNKPDVPAIEVNPEAPDGSPVLTSIKINGIIYKLAAVTTVVAADDYLFGIAMNATPTAAELTVSSTDGTATLPTYTGKRYWYIARLASAADIASVILGAGSYRTNAPINQLGGFTKHSSTITANSKTYSVWVSNHELSPPSDYSLRVA